MLTFKLPYKFLAMFLIFSAVMVLVFSLIAYYNSASMIKDIERLSPLSSEQRAVHIMYQEKMAASLLSLSFYVFILAFIFSLFFTRSFLAPVKELYRSARMLKEDRQDDSIGTFAGDELGEVLKTFNYMSESLKEKTAELKRKDRYIASMVDPVWILGEDNTVVEINPAFTRLFGYEREEAIGSSVFDFLDEEAEKALRRQLQEKAWDEPYVCDLSIIARTEGPIPVLLSSAPVMEEGAVAGAICVIRDFRRDAALREALKDEQEHASAIMDSMTDNLLVIDRDYRIVKANMAARVNAGRDIRGESCHSVFHKSAERCYLHDMDCPVKAVFETGRPFKTVHEHYENGKRTVFEVLAYPVMNRQGEVSHVVEVMRDMTERRSFQDEIEQKNRELMTLNSISGILSQSLKAEDIFNSVLDKVVGLIGMDGGGIYFLDAMGKELRCEYHKGLSADFMKSAGRMKIGQDLIGKVALSGQSLHSPDLSHDARSEKSMLRHSGIKGYTAVPIRGKEKMLGVLYIFSFNAHDFSPEEERVLDSISEMLGIAVENVRYYEKMRELYTQQRQRRAEEQKNHLMLSTMLSESLDMKGSLSSGLSLIKDSCRADFAWLLWADGEGNLSLKASTGGAPEGGVLFPEGTSSIEWYAISKKEPVVLTGISAEPKLYLPPHLKPFDTACSVPLHIGGRVLGALTLYFRTAREPKEEDIDFLQAAGSMLAVALERARLYESVIMEKELAETILKGIADGVMTVDTSGTVISINRAAEKIIGLRPGSAVGSGCCAIFEFSKKNTDLRWTLGECLEEAVQGNSRTAEAILATTDGRSVPIMIRSAPVRDQGNNIAGVVYVLRDVSREREIDMMKTEFVKQASHAFRTPLSAIVGMTEMILQGDVAGDRIRNYIGTIMAEGRRLSGIVSDLLDVARIESGKEMLREREVDFAALLRETQESFAPAIKSKGIRMSSDTEDDVKGYRGDEEKLRQLLRNLIENSLTYSDSGASVSASVKKRGGAILIIVKDSGWGIGEEDLRHAGDKFFRGTNVGDTKGTGLGLSLCKEIARLHGGHLRLESRTGEGTAAVVELPIDRSAGSGQAADAFPKEEL